MLPGDATGADVLFGFYRSKFAAPNLQLSSEDQTMAAYGPNSFRLFSINLVHDLLAPCKKAMIVLFIWQILTNFIYHLKIVFALSTSQKNFGEP